MKKKKFCPHTIQLPWCTIWPWLTLDPFVGVCFPLGYTSWEVFLHTKRHKYLIHFCIPQMLTMRIIHLDIFFHPPFLHFLIFIPSPLETQIVVIGTKNFGNGNGTPFWEHEVGRVCDHCGFFTSSITSNLIVKSK